MAKKSVEGQMELFELFGSVEELEEKIKGAPEKQEVQSEQSLPVVHEVWKPSTPPVMQRCFCNRESGEMAVIAYLDYHMVYLKDWEKSPIIYRFEHSKDAVDFYVEQMGWFLGNEKGKMQKEPVPLLEASVIIWTKEQGA